MTRSYRLVTTLLTLAVLVTARGMHAMLDELAEAFDVADQLSPNPYVSKAEISMAMLEE